MWNVLGSHQHTPNGWTRRQALQAGALSALGGGLGLSQALQAEETPGRRPGRAKNVILLYLLGGAATQDMVDLKLTAPAEIRGEFGPIRTTVPGTFVCEHLPKMSRWMHKVAVVRSLNHQAGCHNPLPSYSGYDKPLLDIVSTRDSYPPSMGSVVESLRQGQRDLPDYVYMPCYLGWGQSIRRPGPYSGFLGSRCEPLYTECKPTPATPAPRAGYPAKVLGTPYLPSSTLEAGLTLDRLDRRQSLVQQVDQQLRRAEGQVSLDNHDRVQQRAYRLLTSADARSAFDLDREDARTRDRYGRSLFGNCTLTARRLVQSGVRFVNVTWDLFLNCNYDSWDTHTRNFPILKDTNLPEFDQTYSALLEDLEARGMLDETLVVVMSEMGRTPTINRNGGRDHWTHCYSMWFAGGGIRGGSIYGASDSQAAYVRELPASPADVCATIYELLGIDPDMPVHDRGNRPYPAAQGGHALRSIML